MVHQELCLEWFQSNTYLVGCGQRVTHSDMSESLRRNGRRYPKDSMTLLRSLPPHPLRAAGTANRQRYVWIDTARA